MTRHEYLEDWEPFDFEVGDVRVVFEAEGDIEPSKRGPIGFAPSGRKRERKIGGRRPGTWPSVPRFDIPPR